eukprot:GHVU01026956.1.p1 GENE.GHVU01026956.1~~GHVU01026956.1.p1  ORF type:complete len:128 (+),score=7.49 GHVU01026956.1:646-1029(+)
MTCASAHGCIVNDAGPAQMLVHPIKAHYLYAAIASILAATNDQRPTTRGKSSSVQYCSQQAIESRGVSPQPAPTIFEYTASKTRAAYFLRDGTLEECGADVEGCWTSGGAPQRCYRVWRYVLHYTIM